MANIQSQIKRNRQNEKRHERNTAIRSELKTRSRNAIVAAETGDAGHEGIDNPLDQPASDRRIDAVAAVPEGQGPGLDRLGLRRHDHSSSQLRSPY